MANVGPSTHSPPGPSGLPVVGNLPSFLRDPLDFYRDMATYDTDVVRYSVMGRRGYLLKHPDDIEQVLVRDQGTYVRGDIVQDAFGGAVGNGLFVVEGERWRNQRTLVQPAFTRDQLTDYGETMVDYAAAKSRAWNDGAVLEMDREMRMLTLEILTKTLFDIDVRDRETAIGEMADAALDRFDTSSLSAWLPTWIPTPRNRRFRRALRDARQQVDELIAEHRASTTDGSDLLTLLLQAADDADVQFSDAELRDNMLTFLFAGHETTALALTYTWYLLATHPGKAARLRTELDQVLAGRPPTVDDLPDLPYTNWTVKEAMRLYPPAPTMFRQPTTDVEIGGYPIPEGSFLSLSPFVVQRDARWYDEADVFRPERWHSARTDPRPDYAYFPFGGGPRHCVGMRFALLEAQLTVATLAQEWTFEPEIDKLALSMAITLQPEEPVTLRVSRG